MESVIINLVIIKLITRLKEDELGIKEIINYIEETVIKTKENSNQKIKEYLDAINPDQPEDRKKLLNLIESFLSTQKEEVIEEITLYKDLNELLELNKSISLKEKKVKNGESFNIEINDEDRDEAGEEEENSFEYLTEDEREIFIEPSYFSIFELYRKYRREELILGPNYQRKMVWTILKNSTLIESVLLKIPIPSLYFAETKDNKWEVVDGQQRLRALFDYFDEKYIISSLSVLTQLNGMSFKSLPAVHQRKLEDYQLHVFVIKKDSHPDIKFDIFERVNEGAVHLNAQELRNGMYRNGEIEFIRKLANDKYFIFLTDGRLNMARLKDEEAVLRFLAFYLQGYQNYKGNLNSFLNAALDQFPKDQSQLDEINRTFSTTMETITDVFGDKAFMKGNSTRINMALFEIISYSFAQFPREQLLNHKEQIERLFNELIVTDQDFIKTKVAKQNVINRFEKWLAILSECIEGGI